MIEQTMTLGEGWNWMSLSVVANDMNATSLMSPISGSVDVVKSKKRSIMRYENVWDGGDILMNNREMYKVLMNNAEELSVIGLYPTDSERTITVRNGWNWLAYNGTAAISLGDAFASLNPVDGDLVRVSQASLSSMVTNGQAPCRLLFRRKVICILARLMPTALSHIRRAWQRRRPPQWSTCQ